MQVVLAMSVPQSTQRLHDAVVIICTLLCIGYIRGELGAKLTKWLVTFSDITNIPRYEKNEILG